MTELKNKKPWRKVLYEKQNYPDNYTDPNIFLKDLKKNIDFKEVNFVSAFVGAGVLLQELCIVILFAIIYFYVFNGWVESWIMLYGASGMALFGFIFYKIKITDDLRKHTLGYDIRTVLTYIAFGQLFSPILHTLTDTISTDTIHMMAFLMMLIHLIFFDYGVAAAIVSKSVSISAAMFASICLASRLASAFDAFVLLTLATQLFVLFPILRTELGFPFILTALLFLLDVYFLRVSLLLIIAFIFIVVLITLVCPLLFVKYQKYKDNIYGPWDEAVVQDADSILF